MDSRQHNFTMVQESTWSWPSVIIKVMTMLMIVKVDHQLTQAQDQTQAHPACQQMRSTLADLHCRV